jgi:hypothetical protein
MFSSLDQYAAFLSERESAFFPYPAIIPWHLQDQIFWDLSPVRHWLLSQVGPYKTNWSWSHVHKQEVYDCCVAFRRDPDRTLFLLRWGTD